MRRALTPLHKILLALALAIFCIYQPLDAAADMASQLYNAGDHNLSVRSLAAFDTIDDGLDHIVHSNGHAAHAQIPLVGLPCAISEALPIPAPAKTLWFPAICRPLLNRAQSPPFYPPRT